MRIVYFSVPFETRTATGSELFSLLTCLHTTAFALPSIVSPLEMLGIKIWETPMSWHTKCPLPVVVRVSKTCMLKLPNIWSPTPDFWSHWRPVSRNFEPCLLCNLLLKFSQQGILWIFVNLWLVFDVLGAVCISVSTKSNSLMN